MNCPKVQQLLSEHLDGELGTERAAGVERHLAHCPACAAEWRALRATVRMVGHLGRQECPVDLRPAVVRAVAREPLRRPAGMLLQRAFAVAVGGSAVLACLSLPLVLKSAVLTGAGSFSGVVQKPTPPPAAPLHIQYNMATVLGPTDGLLLALPTRRSEPMRGETGDDGR